MVKEFQKINELKVNFTNTKDNLLHTISHLLGIDVAQFRNLSHDELSQIISTLVADRKKRAALMIAYRNPTFTSEFMAHDMERQLNNKNFSRYYGQSKVFPLPEPLFLALKFVASANTKDAIESSLLRRKRTFNMKTAAVTQLPSNDNTQRYLR